MRSTVHSGVLALAWCAWCVMGAAPAVAGTLECPPDSVKVGTACIDLYKESVWQIPPSNTALVKKVLAGKATLPDLTRDGATQLGCTFAPWYHTAYPANFPSDGNWTPVLGSSPPSPGVYAVSIRGVLPSTCTTWFQAVQACAVSGKRLARNEEWQRAAAGTPDPGNSDDGTTTCVTNSAAPANTGSRSKCKSSWGVFDMVGNASEWVADWAERTRPETAAHCTDWHSTVGFSDGDLSCFGSPGGLGGAGDLESLPAALVRGGAWTSGYLAGVFAVFSDSLPSFGPEGVAFRCAR